MPRNFQVGKLEVPLKGILLPFETRTQHYVSSFLVEVLVEADVAHLDLHNLSHHPNHDFVEANVLAHDVKNQ